MTYLRLNLAFAAENRKTATKSRKTASFDMMAMFVGVSSATVTDFIAVRRGS